MINNKSYIEDGFYITPCLVSKNTLGLYISKEKYMFTPGCESVSLFLPNYYCGLALIKDSNLIAIIVYFLVPRFKQKNDKVAATIWRVTENYIEVCKWSKDRKKRKQNAN